MIVHRKASWTLTKAICDRHSQHAKTGCECRLYLMAVMQRDDDSKQSADDDDDYDDVDGDVGERLATSSQLCAVADCCTAEEAPVSARRRRRQGQGH